MSIRTRKTPQTVSRTWICTKSAEISTESMRLLFCTEKIILSNKLRGKLNNKRFRVKIRFTVEREVVDGSKVENKVFRAERGDC